MSHSHMRSPHPGFPSALRPEAGLLRRLADGVAAALAAPVLAFATGVPLRSAHHLLPDAND